MTSWRELARASARSKSLSKKSLMTNASDRLRARVPQGDERAVLRAGAEQAGNPRGEDLLLLEVVRADALDAELQGEFQPGERLDRREHRRRRFEPGVASGGESRRIRSCVGKRRLLREPAGVERAQRVVARMHVEPAGTGAAAGVVPGATGGVAVSAVPQSPKNFCPGGLAVPQAGQAETSGAPHSPQNFWPSGLT